MAPAANHDTELDAMDAQVKELFYSILLPDSFFFSAIKNSFRS